MRRTDEKAERVLRICGGLAAGIALGSVAVFVHEGGHWLFTVPQGGSLLVWHWIPPDAVVVLASEPWGTISLYMGGLVAALFLATCLALIIWRFRPSNSVFWWSACLPLAFGAPAELFAGIAEGSLNDFYNGSLLFFVWDVLIGLLGIWLYWRMVPRPQDFRRNNLRWLTAPGDVPESIISGGCV